MVVQWSEVRTAWQDSDFITECLCWHNVYRQRHGAPQLYMAPELCDYAQAWANHLAHTNRFYYRNDRDVGQNLYQRPYSFFKEPDILHANVNAARSRAGKVIVVANYSAPGNCSGQFETNVLPPLPENFPDIPVPPLPEH
ncbi:hypothetical protein MSG28_000005 [Choristoneura fumiferana]|uniref:Uncharacterized protein n=1 Tax=Choristoneura fumiferana TaxID=7141 RepID=A0ACC0JZ39_CHOFU|nr:hypothetical protein MSG28_000005 [Choristoneura fumiferana]